MFDIPFGYKNSPDNATYTGTINRVYGGAADSLIAAFPTPTVILISISGTVTQGPDAMWVPNPPLSWGPLGNTPSTHSGAMGYILSWSVDGGGSQAYWPTMVSNYPALIGGQIKMKGFRADLVDAQPAGDGTHCGYGRAPPLWCYAYSGAAGLSFTRPPASIMLTGNGTGTAMRNELVTITAGPTPATIAGIATPLSDLSFGWIPDVRGVPGDTVACETYGALTCQKRMLSSGTVFVTGYANGHEEIRSLHLAVEGDPEPNVRRCADIPGYSTDHPDIANPAMDNVFKTLWEQSNFKDTSPDQKYRREQGGWIIRNGSTYSFQPFAATPESCSIEMINEVRPDSAISIVHVHPWQFGERMTGCGPKMVTNPDGTIGIRYDANGLPMYEPYQLMPSEDDFGVSKKYGDLQGYMLDQNGISKFRHETDELLRSSRLQRCGY